jgi:uncharacterized membrane protein
MKTHARFRNTRSHHRVARASCSELARGLRALSPTPLILASLLLTAPALAQPSFQHLGDLPGGRFFSEAICVSGDGRVVFGDSVTGGVPPNDISEAFYWTAQTGIQTLDPSRAGLSSTPFAASFDGSVTAGYIIFPNIYTDIEIFRWTSASGAMDILGDLPGGFINSSARGLSADGSILVGTGSSQMSFASCSNCVESFRWTAPDGLVPMGDVPGGSFDSRAYGISADGTVIAGEVGAPAGPVASRWTAQTGFQTLGFLNSTGYQQSEAWCISANSQVICGRSTSMNTTGMEAFRWTAAGGMEALGDLPGGPFASLAMAVSADGSIIVGQGTMEGGPFGFGATRAFIWDRPHGLRPLRDVLVNDYGLAQELEGWDLFRAQSISADGRTIVGLGINPDGLGEAFVAYLGPPPPYCPADLDGNGVVNLQDFLAYLQLYAAGDPRADFNGDGSITVNDFLAFLAAYAAGC